jgi:hypothetical protein
VRGSGRGLFKQLPGATEVTNEERQLGKLVYGPRSDPGASKYEEVLTPRQRCLV